MDSSEHEQVIQRRKICPAPRKSWEQQPHGPLGKVVEFCSCRSASGETSHRIGVGCPVLGGAGAHCPGETHHLEAVGAAIADGVMARLGAGLHKGVAIRVKASRNT